MSFLAAQNDITPAIIDHMVICGFFTTDRFLYLMPPMWVKAINKIADVFEVNVRTINEHLQNIYTSK